MSYNSGLLEYVQFAHGIRYCLQTGTERVPGHMVESSTQYITELGGDRGLDEITPALIIPVEMTARADVRRKAARAWTTRHRVHRWTF